MEHQNTVSEPYVDRKYLAEYFGVDIKTIINWSETHHWIAYKFSSRCVRYKLSEVLMIMGVGEVASNHDSHAA